MIQNIILIVLKNSINNLYLIFFKKFLVIIIFLIFLRIDINNESISLDIKYFKKKTNKIRIGIAVYSIKNGGSERQTSLILNYFNQMRIFKLFLFTIKEKEENEYLIDNSIERITFKKNLTEKLAEKNIDILIYQFYNEHEMKQLNNLTNIKTIFINRSCFLHWIYYNSYFIYKTIYNVYKKSKYIISLIPFENDYLFKKWGIKSILMNNFIPYEQKSISPSNLSSKNILMIGRGDDPVKRFDMGIKAMPYIIKEIPECQMIVISKNDSLTKLKKLVNELKLENNVKFVGYTPNPEIFYKNASLHIFPTVAEAFPNILTETLSYGIPNILTGLDYSTTSKGGGTVITYKDTPLSIAELAIKILKNNKYRKKLGKEARKNIRKFRNELLLKKWIKIILSVYRGDNNYEKLREKDKKISENEALKILENQLNLLKLRKKKFVNLTINEIENFSFMENLV